MKLKNLSIKWKLFFCITLFAVAMLMLLWLFQIVFLDNFYQSIKTRQIRSAADAITVNIDNGDLQELVSRLAQSEDVCIVVLDEQGTPLHSADVLFDCVIHRAYPNAFLQWMQKADENSGSYLEIFHREPFRDNGYNSNRFKGRVPPPGPVKSESLIYVKQAETSQGHARTVILNSSISPVGSTVETLRIQLSYITVILVLLAFLLALYISRKISKPVIRINQSAKQLAKGAYGVRFEGGGYREIAELSDTLNKAAYELSRVESLRRELIANVSHDLRTPLTMITGYAEAIRDLPGENNPENAQIIIDEAHRLTRLVADLLDLSRLQEGESNLNPERFNLTESIRHTIERFSGHLERDGGGIQFQSDTDCHVFADELHISQVVYNLIANAVTHSSKGSPVLLRQTEDGNLVKIEVCDHGPGIPKDQLPYIWERYYKVDKTHKRAQVGSGLGLSIVRNTLEQHNARYGVESALGRGSTFWFALPKA